MWNIEKWQILAWYPNKTRQHIQQNPKCREWRWTNFQIQVALSEWVKNQLSSIHTEIIRKPEMN